MKQLSFLIPIALLLLAAPYAGAQEIVWYERVDMNGFLSTSFTYNLNTPASMENGERIFDRHHNSFAFDVFQLVVRSDAEKAGDAGFRFDLITGALPQYTASSGLFGGGNIDVLQGYVSYIIPVGSGLTVDAGKFLTHMGYELIEGYDGWNDNVSRSFLFGYAIPFAHTGIRTRYGFSESVSAMVMLANGWDNAVENNTNKTVGAQLAVTPVADLFLAVNGIHGAEGEDDNSNNTSVFDLVGIYTVSELLTVGVNADFGSARTAAEDGADASWSGVAGYIRLNLSDAFSISLRGEQFDDADGLRTGTQQKLTELTVTPEYRPTDRLVLRADFRMDSSDKDVFEKGASLSDPTLKSVDSQTTIGLNMLITF
ncbi:MAG: porin [Bacteroidetes bacterium]|nr:porin [Bacteroidota bacterium]